MMRATMISRSNTCRDVAGRLAAIAAVLGMLLGVAAGDEAVSASLIKRNNAWSAYSEDAPGGKLCFILSSPTQQEPADRNHGEVFFMLARHPDPDIGVQPRFSAGYLFKDNTTLVLDIDGQRFTMFTRGRDAWVRTLGDDALVVEAMKAGQKMSISAESRRGTRTQYVYSLSGVTASLGAIANCG